MLKYVYLLLLSLFILCDVQAQIPDSINTVQITAEVVTNPPQIRLSWYTLDRAEEYDIFKKEFGQSGPLAYIRSVGPDDTSWLDTDVDVGTLYHYKIVRSDNGSTEGNGYLTAGIQTTIESDMGIILLVVDTSIIQTGNEYIVQYRNDLINEGWRPKFIEVHRDTTAKYVKSLIQEQYELNQEETNALVLIGHVPVPYSGEINPDGHGDHIGAWPTDAYYADVDGSWTDFLVNNTSASKERNHNEPRDGKFDQSLIPGEFSGPERYVELETGRIDFVNLDAFQDTELELLERYFKKNHAYRSGLYKLRYRGLIENNFQGLQEGFGQNGLRDFATMFGADSVFYMDYDNVKNEPYMWVYACGPGNYRGAGGINNVNSMVQDSIQAIFTMHFGSYFGDWDNNTGNYLRSALGSGTILTNAWAARPNWPNYYMAMGKNIGFVAKMAMSNPDDIHFSQFGNRWIHIALMGDPSLRMYVTDAPGELTLEKKDYGIQLNWEPPKKVVAGYNVYVRTAPNSAFEQLNDTIIPKTTFLHDCPLEDTIYEYMVRSVELKETASGTFYNLSPGLRDSISYSGSSIASSDFSFDRFGDTLVFTNHSFNATYYKWNFGDSTFSSEENPTHVYTESGDYTIQLIAGNECSSDTFSIELEVILTNLDPFGKKNHIRIYPNPAQTTIFVANTSRNFSYNILSNTGAIMAKGQLPVGSEGINVNNLSPGVYILKIYAIGEDQNFHLKFVKLE